MRPAIIFLGALGAASSFHCTPRPTHRARHVARVSFGPVSGAAKPPTTGLVDKANAALVAFMKDAIGARFVERDNEYARFYALETIARVPYFAYLSVLHLYETTGRWRHASTLRLHFEQSYNELHHLRTMEALGGGDRWDDRFVAQHIAFGYYWAVVALFLASPQVSMRLCRCAVAWLSSRRGLAACHRRRFAHASPTLLPRRRTTSTATSSGTRPTRTRRTSSGTGTSCARSQRRTWR